MAAQANNAALMHNTALQAALVPALQAINVAWRAYHFNLEVGNINHIIVTPPQYQALGENGLKAIGNRYRYVKPGSENHIIDSEPFSNFIQAPVNITRDETTNNILIQPSHRLSGRFLASDQAAVGERKNLSGKLPRPPNSFILYRQQHHPRLKEAHPTLHNNQICKCLPFHLSMPY